MEAETIDAQREEAERKARLLEKLQQQAQELRRQKEIERQQRVAEAEEVARKAMDQLKNMQLKSLLEGMHSYLLLANHAVAQRLNVGVISSSADDDTSPSTEKLPDLMPKLKPSKPAAEGESQILHQFWQIF